MNQKIKITWLESNQISNEVYEFISEVNCIDRTDYTKFLSEQKKFSAQCTVNNQVTGYIEVSDGFQKEEAVIYAILHPLCKRKTFPSVLKEVLLKLKEMKKTVVRFIHPLALDIKSELETAGFKYVYSTYEMQLKKTDIMQNNQMVIRSAQSEDLEEMTKIGMDAFGTNKEDELEYNKKNIKSNTSECYVGIVDDVIVGMVSVKFIKNVVRISDLAVHSIHRGKGYGSAILQHTVHRLLNDKNEDIRLSVKADNAGALKLYKESGFVITDSTDIFEQKI